MFVKITQKGWETYNGPLGMTEFKDGVSVGHISKQEAYALGSHISIIEIDEAGNELGPVSLSHDMVRQLDVSATVVEPTKRQSEIDAEDALKAEAKAKAEAEAGIKTYTKEELEAIAETKGIAGLRDIATPLGIKGVAVKTLIAEILVHQKAA